MPQEIDPCNVLNRGCVGPKAGLDILERRINIFALLRIEPPVIINPDRNIIIRQTELHKCKAFTVVDNLKS